jgi:uncharacterized SAM-binding protein YcdF (DUF218 family)
MGKKLRRRKGEDVEPGRRRESADESMERQDTLSVEKGLDSVFTLRIKKIYVLVAAALILAFALLLMLLRPSIVNVLAGWLTVRGSLEKCDVIFVLGGREERRVPFAAGLFKQGYGSRLILTLGKQDGWVEEADAKYGVKCYPESLMEGLIKTERLPKSSIVFLRGSLSTLDDMKKLRDYYEKNKFSSALIVTDPIHSRRSMLCARWLFKGTGVRLVSWPLPLEGFPDKFSDREDYWNYVIEEYLRYAYYRLGFRRG